MDDQMGPQPGWYENVYGKTQWWDGSQWGPVREEGQTHEESLSPEYSEPPLVGVEHSIGNDSGDSGEISGMPMSEATGSMQREAKPSAVAGESFGAGRSRNGKAANPKRDLVLVALVAVGLVAGYFISEAAKPKPQDMLDNCKARVALEESVGLDSVFGEDVSHLNYSGAAWDFRGTYPGGAWACGGPSGQKTPSQVLTYPDGPQ